MSSKGRSPTRVLSPPREAPPTSDVYCTAVLACPRSDLPRSATHNKTVRKQVFKRRGDATSVSTDLDYNSLYDPHLKGHFGKKQSVRNVLVRQGLITDDFRVIGTSEDVFQALKANRIVIAQNDARAKIARKDEGRMARVANPRALPRLIQEQEERTRLRKVNAELRRRKKHEREAEMRREEVQAHREAESATRQLAIRKARAHAEKQAMRQKERKLRQQMGLYRGAQLPPLPQNVTMDDVEPEVLKDVLTEESLRLGKKLNALQDEAGDDVDSDEERAVQDALRQERQARLDERRERIRKADERRFAEAQERQRRREAAEKEEERRIIRMSQPRNSSAGRERRRSPPRKSPSPEPAAAAAAAELEAVPEPEPQADPAALKRAQYQSDAAAWAGDAAAALARLGVAQDWLVEAALYYVHVVDHGRTGSLAPELLLHILSSPALGLNLSDAQEAQLLDAMAVESEPPHARQVRYVPMLATLGDTLAAIELSDTSLATDRTAWCLMYDPAARAKLWYNKATKAVAAGELPPTPEYADAETREAFSGVREDFRVVEMASPPDMADGAAACKRCVMRVMDTSNRSLEDEPAKMEEEVFYMMLQSTEVGLGLDAEDVDAYKDEMPPEVDGNVDFVEAVDDLAVALSSIMEDKGAAATNNWCCLYSTDDSLFFYNKSTQQMCKKRPDAFQPSHDALDIDRFLFALFKANDPQETGLIDEPTFWELLESEPPTGLSIQEEDSFSMMTKFDLSIDGKVPYRKFVPIFRAMMVAVSAESEDTPEGPLWVELAADGVGTFWFDKVSATCSRRNPADSTPPPTPPALQAAQGPLQLTRTELSDPVYAKLSERFPSTIGMFATHLPSPLTGTGHGPAYVTLSTQYPSTISSFASYPTPPLRDNADDAPTEDAGAYRKMSSSYPSTIGMFA